MARPEKVEQVKLIKEKLDHCEAAVIADYRGLSVQEMAEVRGNLREAGVEFRVVKNTLARIAATELKLDNLVTYFEGPTAIAFSYEDPIAPAKLLVKLSKEHEDLEVRGGLLEGEVIDSARVGQLAALPSRDELMAKLAGSCAAPLSGIARVAQGPLTTLVTVLKRIEEQKAQAA